MWMRACPHCGTELMKAALDFRIKCACGWVWESDIRRDVRRLAANGELVYTNEHSPDSELAKAA